MNRMGGFAGLLLCARLDPGVLVDFDVGECDPPGVEVDLCVGGIGMEDTVCVLFTGRVIQRQWAGELECKGVAWIVSVA